LSITYGDRGIKVSCLCPQGVRTNMLLGAPGDPSTEVVLAQGAIEPEEMARTFNCGIGMAVIVAADEARAVTSALEGAGETVFAIGRIEAGERGCTVRAKTGTWGSPEDWSATHNA
jgi:phosphoribosylformylglycinamidine cyclo-ligase